MSMFSGGELAKHYGCQFFAVAIVLALIINLIALSIVYAIGHIDIVWK